ncbi:MAG: Mrp/NBP35 family ATP-binding protein [Planctomycetota bacterium]
MISEANIRRWLSAVTPAGEPANVVDEGRLEWVSVLEGSVAVRLHLPSLRDQPEAMEAVAAACLEAIRQGAVRAGERIRALTVEFVDDAGTVVRTSKFEASPRGALRPADTASAPDDAPAPSAPAASDAPAANFAIAVGAGKGGVGKSSIATNLAVGLARRGHAVGLLDADIYGPSVPAMLGLAAHEPSTIAGRFQPFYTHGVKSMTIGKLVEADKALIWRGPMAHGAVKQMVEKTDWGELDHLVIDLPPGTGDVPLTLAQTLRLTGAVVVCTPQRVAQDDAVRAVRMFEQLEVPVLGVVENMSVFIADDGTEYDIFGRGGAQQMAQRLGVPFLGAVPLAMDLRANSDAGDPTANFQTDTVPMRRVREAFEAVLSTLESQLALASLGRGRAGPTLTIH